MSQQRVPNPFVNYHILKAERQEQRMNEFVEACPIFIEKVNRKIQSAVDEDKEYIEIIVSDSEFESSYPDILIILLRERGWTTYGSPKEVKTEKDGQLRTALIFKFKINNY